MVEAVGIVGSGGGVDALRAAKPVVPAAAGGQAADSVAQSVIPISPSMRLDPTAGVLITEFYASDGQLKGQIPSAAKLANLRAGLTATGQVVPDEPPPTHEPLPSAQESVAMLV